MMMRLFLAESRTPEMGGYNEKNVKTAMLWMRKVIENRLSHPSPSIFLARKQAGSSNYTRKDIITARGQFHGFDSYPSILEKLQKNIQIYLTIANNYQHRQQDNYIRFIEAARFAASNDALKDFSDPCDSGLYGWRTALSSPPGGDFVFYKKFAGQDFYTLNKSK